MPKMARMKSIRPRRPFDAAPIENRIEHFPSQIVRVMWTMIIVGSAEHEIIWSDVLGLFKMLRQNTLETSRHMSNVLLAGLG